MVTRRSWALMILTGIVAILLLSRSYRSGDTAPPAAGQERVEAEAKGQALNLSTDETESSTVPESPRHTAGEIEKHRLARLAALDKTIKDQEEKVEERRKVLGAIVRSNGIIYKGPDSSKAESAEAGDVNARTALESRNLLERDKIQLESQIGSMKKYQGEQLMVYAAGLDFPDNQMKVLYPQYQEARRGLDALKSSGRGSVHPTLKAKADQVEAVKIQIDEEIVKLRATAQAQLDMANDHLNRGESAKLAQDYVHAKRDYETDHELLEELKRKRITEDKGAEQGGR